MHVPPSLERKLLSKHLLQTLRSAQPEDHVTFHFQVRLIDEDGIATNDELDRCVATNVKNEKETLHWLRDNDHPVTQHGKRWETCLPVSVAIGKLRDWFDAEAITAAYDQVDIVHKFNTPFASAAAFQPQPQRSMMR